VRLTVRARTANDGRILITGTAPPAHTGTVAIAVRVADGGRTRTLRVRARARLGRFAATIRPPKTRRPSPRRTRILRVSATSEAVGLALTPVD
jgi:hypothetical protein